jgi:hypothetical protein
LHRRQRNTGVGRLEIGTGFTHSGYLTIESGDLE